MKQVKRHPDDWVPVSLEPDPVIDVYKAGIDMTLLKKNLSLTVEQRIENLMAVQAVVEELRQAGIRVGVKAKQELLRNRILKSPDLRHRDDV